MLYRSLDPSKNGVKDQFAVPFSKNKINLFLLYKIIKRNIECDRQR